MRLRLILKCDPQIQSPHALRMSPKSAPFTMPSSLRSEGQLSSGTHWPQALKMRPRSAPSTFPSPEISPRHGSASISMMSVRRSLESYVSSNEFQGPPKVLPDGGTYSYPTAKSAIRTSILIPPFREANPKFQSAGKIPSSSLIPLFSKTTWGGKLG